jgi:hypothetical protein
VGGFRALSDALSAKEHLYFENNLRNGQHENLATFHRLWWSVLDTEVSYILEVHVYQSLRVIRNP